MMQPPAPARFEPSRPRPRPLVGLGLSLAVAAGVAFAACSGGSGSHDVAGAISGSSSSVTASTSAAIVPATGLACTLLSQQEVEQALHLPIANIAGTDASASCSWEPQRSLAGLDLSVTDDPPIAAAEFARQSSPPADPDGDGDGASSAPSNAVTPTELGDKAFFLDKQGVVELYVLKGGKLLTFRLHTNDYPALVTGSHDTLAALAGSALARY